MHVWSVGIEPAAIAVVLREVSGLGNQIDHIKTETAYTFVAPKAHQFVDFGPHPRVVPIEVGLGVIKQMQIVLAGLGLVLPRRAAELGLPVIGLVAPDVKVAVRVVEAATRLHEPFMFDRGVVDHNVEHQLDASGAGFADQQLAIGHAAVARVNGVVITDVIAIVALR